MENLGYVDVDRPRYALPSLAFFSYGITSHKNHQMSKVPIKKRALKSERKGNNRLIVSFLFTFQKLQNLTKALASKSLPNPSTTFAIFHPFCRWLTFQHVAVENCVEKAVFTFPPPPLSRSSGTRASQNPSDLCYRRFRR